MSAVIHCIKYKIEWFRYHIEIEEIETSLTEDFISSY